MDGLDDVLAVGVVIDRLSRLHDGTGQRGFGDEHPRPHRILQFVLADGAVVVGRQVDQQVEYARLHLDNLPVPAQFAPRRIDGEGAEAQASSF